MMTKKVFVIDYEIISPIAFGKENLHSGLANNVKGESVVSGFDTASLPFRVAAEVKNSLSHLYENEHPDIVHACQFDRKLELIVACYNLAAKRFEKLCNNLDPTRGGSVVGVGSDVTKFAMFEEDLESIFALGDNPHLELIAQQNKNNTRLNTMWNPYDIHTIYLAEKLKLAAFQKTTLTACTSSTQALALGFDAVKNDKCDVVVVGGTDSILNTLALSSFGKLGVIDESDGHNLPTCLPFDSNRKGTLAGEAAGLVFLASEEYVNRNNLTPIAEILSYGNTLDGYKITAPDPSGKAMRRAMEIALKNGGVDKNEINYIQAHGTATRHNDIIEIEAVMDVFGDLASKIPLSSTKDRHGHAIGAAGVQELAVLLNCMENDLLPSNMNMKNPIKEEMNLLKENTKQKINYALTNNFAFGGVNTVLLVKNMK